MGTSLARVGAYVPPIVDATHANLEVTFLDWLEAQHPAIPEVIEKSCKYVSLYSAEAALNLLEHGGCEHVDDLVDPEDHRPLLS